MAQIVVAGDTSGSATIAAPAVAGTPTLTLPTTSGTLLTTGSTTGINGSAISSGIVGQAFGGTGTTTGYYGFKNRIINGAMVIDQRNAGASVNSSAGVNVFPVDRTNVYVEIGSSGVLSLQQSSVAPAGFTNSIICTVTTADSSITASEGYTIQHRIEGFNTADLGFGTVNAKTITLSFWVRSSLTGTFSGSITNGSFNRSYIFDYTISSANTFEYKTVTIPGDTSGTWVGATNGTGMVVYFNLGAGSNFVKTANTWGGLGWASSGSTNLIATNGATFYITGVQLEVGSTATSFDYRPYGTELALCQRYYWEANQTTFNANTWNTGANSAVHNLFTFRNPVEMRAAPTAGISGTFTVYSAGTNASRNSIATSQMGTLSSRILFSLVGSSGNSCWIDSDSSSSKLTFSAEL